MTREFVELPSFRKAWISLGFGENELKALEEMLLDDPKVGRMIEGTGGVKKCVMRSTAAGKAEARVLFTSIWR